MSKIKKRIVASFLSVVLVTAVFLVQPENVAYAAFGEGGYVYEPPSGSSITEIFHLVGNTKVDSQYPNVALVNRDEKHKYGAMWAKKKLDLTLPFETEMYLHLGHAEGVNSILADGMTFTLHNDPRGINALGSNGEGLGVYGSGYFSFMPSTWPNLAVVSKSLVIEFDTYTNDFRNDDDHFMKDPTKAGYNAHSSVMVTKNPNDFDSGKLRISETDHQNTIFFNAKQEWVLFQVQWTPEIVGNTVGGTLTYSFDGTTKSYQVSNVKNIFGGTEVYWGFSGSTGEHTSLQAAAIVSLPEQEEVETPTDPVKPITPKVPQSGV